MRRIVTAAGLAVVFAAGLGTAAHSEDGQTAHESEGRSTAYESQVRANPAKCRVTDPTDTPLNVRTGPNAAIVATLRNGKLVTILNEVTTGGKGWAYIGDFSDGNRPIGWVYREFLSCF